MTIPKRTSDQQAIADKTMREAVFLAGAISAWQTTLKPEGRDYQSLAEGDKEVLKALGISSSELEMFKELLQAIALELVKPLRNTDISALTEVARSIREKYSE